MIGVRVNHCLWLEDRPRSNPPVCSITTSISSPFSMFSSLGVWPSCSRSPSKRNLTLPGLSCISQGSYALALAVRIHQLLESSRVLDLEEDLLTVLRIGPVTWLLTLRLSCSGLVAVASVIASKKRI